jgi:hypothetical protein
MFVARNDGPGDIKPSIRAPMISPHFPVMEAVLVLQPVLSKSYAKEEDCPKQKRRNDH